MIDRRFSAAAATYDRHAEPQQALARAVAALLPEEAPARILELGAGTGQLTRLAADRYPETAIDAVDLAEQMVAYSRKKFASRSSIRWMTGDARTFKGHAPYPLIISSAALHWLEHPQEAFRHIASLLLPGGRFILGLMLRGTLHELHAIRAGVAPRKAPARTLPTADEVADALGGAGLHIEQRLDESRRFIYPDAAAFLRAIHEQGVTGGRISRSAAPLNRTELRRLTERYDAECAVPNGVYATYETATFLMSRPD